VGARREDLGGIDGLRHVRARRQVQLGRFPQRLDHSLHHPDRASAGEGPTAGRALAGVALDHVHAARLDADLLGQSPVGLGVPLTRLRSARQDLDPALLRDPDPRRVKARHCSDAPALVVRRAGAAVLVEEADPDPEEAALGAG